MNAQLDGNFNGLGLYLRNEIWYITCYVPCCTAEMQ